jgi:branched-chain amino acid transport system substrate-binding protein
VSSFVWRQVVVALLCAAAVLVLAACGRGGGSSSESGSGSTASSPGINDKEVVLGSSQILTGPASVYSVLAKTVEAYFKQANAEGGIAMGDGKTRNVDFKYYDDAFDPSRAVANMRRLVEQDGVFATFGQAGSSSVAASQAYLNSQEVPQLFVFSGDSAWGSNPAKEPWTMGCAPAYTTEASFYVNYLEREMPDAKVAVLFENDDLGQDLLKGFEAAIGGTEIEVVDKQSYAVTDPTVDSQMVNLANSGADVFLDVSTPKFAAAAIAKMHQLDWHPLHLLAAVSASSEVLQAAGATADDHIVSYTYVKDPASKANAGDPGVEEYEQALKRYAPEVDPANQIATDAWACADAMRRTLEGTKEPTRAALMESARSLNGAESALLLPGITFNTDGTKDGFPLESGQLQRYDGKSFELIGDVIDYEGRTPHAGG